MSEPTYERSGRHLTYGIAGLHSASVWLDDARPEEHQMLRQRAAEEAGGSQYVHEGKHYHHVCGPDCALGCWYQKAIKESR